MPKGYAIEDPKNWTDFQVKEFELKTEDPEDVTVAIEFCGLCASDLHTVSGGWGPFNTDYVIAGHEIAGKVIKVGSAVKDFKVGDRVGVGAQVGACLNCPPCKTNNENYCRGDGKKGPVDTYNAKYANGDVAQGGYSTQIRAHEQFVFPVPDGVKLEDAASMFCAGLTVYSPLLRNGCGPNKRVGIVGVGGLGHYGVMWAAAMGAETIAISHSAKKKEDALKMGAKEFISTKEDEKWAEKLAQNPLDLIVCTASSNAVDLKSILSTLGVHGRLVYVGMPNDAFEDVRSQMFAGNGCFMGGSHIGSKEEVLSMLKLAEEKNVRPWIELISMRDVGKAMKRVEDNDIKYRFVMKQDLE